MSSKLKFLFGLLIRKILKRMTSGHRYFENEYIKLSLQEGIMHGVFAPDVRLTLEIAQQSVAGRLRLTENSSYPLLLDLRGITSVTKEARSYCASKEAQQYITKGAFLLRTPAQVIISHFFIFFDRPIVETKMFHKEEEALRWLRKA